MLSFPTLIISTVLFSKLAADFSTGTYFKSVLTESALKGHVIERCNVRSLLECGLKCASFQSDCKSFNYIEDLTGSAICEINNCTKNVAREDDFVKQPNSEYFEPDTDDNNKASTEEIPDSYPTATDGLWTLVARFSNSDAKNWMLDKGTWWYDRQESYGSTLDPSNNTDMISEAFWLLNGSEFRITKSDDPTHTALLTTTGNCLGGKNFRSKLTSYGIFRDSTSWASSKCLGNCPVSYGGDYKTVEGFGQSQCDGSIQSRYKIGFWCDYGGGDGAVLMIGGGGSSCDRADHGIGITEENEASFKTTTDEADFGDESSGSAHTKQYSLNLWVR